MRRNIDADYKLKIYLQIAAYFLEDGDSVQAEAYVKRASLLAPDSRDFKLQLQVTHRRAPEKPSATARSPCARSPADRAPSCSQFKVQQARIYDAKRKFIEAAQRYIELSYIIPDDEQAQMMALTQA